MSTTSETTTSRRQVADVVARAARATSALRASTAAERARWLTAVAEELDAHAAELIAIAAEETHIPCDRLAGEVVRTTKQLRLFAAVIREGSYLEVVIDHADSSAIPPQPDLRRMLIPIGPVAVFTASNFPFAFSVAGGDTASALASGNPVVVKGHSGHARLSARTADLVTEALRTVGAPEGTFGHVTGHEAGIDLVENPQIKAVAFTGSTTGGRALLDRIAQRAEPIPFFGELGSVNPVLVTPSADASRAAELAAGLASSFQTSLGQLCTKPGLVFVPRGAALIKELRDAVSDPASGKLLTPSITTGFADGMEALRSARGVEPLFEERTSLATTAQVWVTDVDAAAATSAVTEEHFGPTTVVVQYDEIGQAVDLIERLGGSLTATLHAEPGERVSEIAARLESLAGRILFDGWPTGVAVTWSQHHGGPWPATTSAHTSVGATALRRFLRPVVYQSAPDALLPPELREGNPLGVARRVDGRPFLG